MAEEQTTQEVPVETPQAPTPSIREQVETYIAAPEAKQEKQEETPKLVPLAALHSERQKMKELKAEIAELRNRPINVQVQQPEPQKKSTVDEFFDQNASDPVVQELRQQRAMTEELRKTLSEQAEQSKAQSVAEGAEWLAEELPSVFKEIPEIAKIADPNEYDGGDSDELKEFLGSLPESAFKNHKSLVKAAKSHFHDLIVEAKVAAAREEALAKKAQGKAAGAQVSTPGTAANSPTAFLRQSNTVKAVEESLAAQGLL